MSFPIKQVVWGALLCAFFSMNSKTFASDSLGLDVTGGAGISGVDTTGTLDIGEQKDYEAFLSYAHMHITPIAESNTNQYSGGVSHTIDDNWEARGSLTYWDDSINEIHYIGPTFGFGYTWRERDESSTVKPQPRPPVNSEPLNPDEETPTKEKVPSGLPAPEIAYIGFDTDFFVYTADIDTSSTTVRRGKQVIVEPAGTTAQKTTQVHPNLTVEKPFFDESVTPYLIAGHYFYSTDPNALADLAGRPRFAASEGTLNALVGGFLSNNGTVGARVELPYDFRLNASLGADKLATGDDSWVTTQEVTLTRYFGDHFKGKLDWSRSIEEGISLDFYTGGLAYYF